MASLRIRGVSNLRFISGGTSGWVGALAEIRVGTSGYSFPDWVGTVYPRDLPQKSWLSYYARWFNAVEINSTYYRIPSPYMMAALVRKVPKG